ANAASIAVKSAGEKDAHRRDSSDDNRIRNCAPHPKQNARWAGTRDSRVFASRSSTRPDSVTRHATPSTSTTTLPEHRVMFDPLAGRAELLHARTDAVIPPGDLSRHQPGAFQHLDVFRHRRDRDVELVGELRAPLS